MFLFAAYAVVVWWLVMRKRRTPAGFVLAALSGVPVAVAARFVPHMATIGFAPAVATPGRGLEGLQILLWAEAGVVAAVAMFIVCLPRPPKGRHCPYCWYDLTGLERETDTCPECGTPRRGYGRPAPPRR